MNSTSAIKFVNTEFLGNFNPEIPYTRKSTINSLERLIEHLAYYLNAKNTNQDAKDRKYYSEFVFNLKHQPEALEKICNDNQIKFQDDQIIIGEKSLKLGFEPEAEPQAEPEAEPLTKTQALALIKESLGSVLNRLHKQSAQTLNQFITDAEI